MHSAPGLSRIELAADDFLAAAGAIPANNANTCSLNGHWIRPATYLAWARRGFRDGDDYGLANAITYAKRAACCRIDRLIHNYHLQRLHRGSFPEKIQALERIGIGIPSVIQELIIDPRNELEHDYVPADAVTARRALDIATLFLSATDSVDSQESIIVLNGNMQYTHPFNLKTGEERVSFNGWSKGAMLFVDIFAEPQTAKIVDGEQREVRYVELAKFTRQEAIELASILHGHYSLQNRGSSGGSPFFYTEIKRLAGL
jgi:hypothetical protein